MKNTNVRWALLGCVYASGLAACTIQASKGTTDDGGTIPVNHGTDSSTTPAQEAGSGDTSTASDATSDAAVDRTSDGAASATDASLDGAAAATDSGSDGGALAPIGDAATLIEQKLAMSTTMQGEVSLGDGAKLAVPMWAIPVNSQGAGIAVEFSLARTDATAVPPAGATVASSVYKLGPEHLTFAEPIAVTLPVSGSPAAENVKVYRIDPTTQKRQRYSAVYDAQAKTVTAQTREFSYWFAATTSDASSTADGAFKITNSSPTDWINACVVGRTLKYPGQNDDFPSGMASAAPTGTIGWSSTVNWYLPQGTYSLCVETQAAGTVSSAPGAPKNKLVTGQVLDAAWTSANPRTVDLPVDMTGAVDGPCDCSPQPSQVAMVFYNGNIAGVANQPTAPTVFTTSQCYFMSRIVTYHWNYGSGKTPGTIALSRQGGSTLGPWQAAGTPGQGGVVNAYWNVYPSTVLPIGTYTFVDSDPATWSQNSGSSGTGMAWIEGVPTPCP